MVTCAAGRSQSLEASVVGILVLSWVKLSDFCKLACPHLLGVKTSEPMKFWGKIHKEKEECNFHPPLLVTTHIVLSPSHNTAEVRLHGIRHLRPRFLLL